MSRQKITFLLQKTKTIKLQLLFKILIYSKIMNLKEIIYFNNQKESILIKEKNNN